MELKNIFILLIEGPESWKAVAYQLSLAVLEGSENLMAIQMDLWGEPLHAEVLQESDKKVNDLITYKLIMMHPPPLLMIWQLVANLIIDLFDRTKISSYNSQRRSTTVSLKLPFKGPQRILVNHKTLRASPAFFNTI